ncbi:hypothetical protein [Methanoregula formicica]|uniref:hypothetical protein n=1 Tax=Methanoregula formicica TaxID=882104 RepID=UPI0011D2C1F9|nr:hypothetical protein [Methanoregula formicica]
MRQISHLSGYEQYTDTPIGIPAIRTINFADKARHDRMVSLVTRMLEIRFWPSGQRWIREERLSVLRCGESRICGMRLKKNPERILRCLNKKLQNARVDHDKTLLSGRSKRRMR